MAENFEDSEEIWDYQSLRRKKKTCEVLPSQNVLPQRQKHGKAEVDCLKVKTRKTNKTRVATIKSKPSIRNKASRQTTERIEISDSSDRLSDDAGARISPSFYEVGTTTLSTQADKARDGYCPNCQMPFLCLIDMSPQAHVLHCLDQPHNSTEECPAGVDCDNKSPSHYRRYLHSDLAICRSCCEEIMSQHNRQYIQNTSSGHLVPSTSGNGSSFYKDSDIFISQTRPESQHKAEHLMNNLIDHSLKSVSCDCGHDSDTGSVSDIDADDGESAMIKTFPGIRADERGRCDTMFDEHLNETTSRDVSDMLADALDSDSEASVKDNNNNNNNNTVTRGNKESLDVNYDESTTSSILADLQHAEDSINDLLAEHDTENSADDCVIEAVIGVKSTAKVNSSNLCNTVSPPQAKHGVNNSPSKRLHKIKDNKRVSKTPTSKSKRKDKLKNTDRSQTHLLSFFAPKKTLGKSVNINSDESQSKLSSYFFPKKCLTEVLDSSLNTPEQSLKQVSTGLNVITEVDSSTVSINDSNVITSATKISVRMNTNDAANLNQDSLQKNAITTEEKIKFLQIFRRSSSDNKQAEIIKHGVNSDQKPDLINKQTSANFSAAGVADVAKNQYGQTGRRAKRPCPFYKKIPGTGITVDAFSYGIVPECTAYVLSHFHYDHYGGLTKNFKQPIYCSKVTGNLVCAKLGVDRSYVHALPLNEPCHVEGAEVTLMEANHCPGAVILLFKLTNGSCHLHTGDFRATREMEKYPSLQNCPINQLYLDTTYCDPAYTFPMQHDVIDLAVSIAIKSVEEYPQTLVVCGTYTIGKERVFTALAEALDCQICVRRDKQLILDCLDDPALKRRLTLSPQQTRLHVLPMNKLKYICLTEYLNGLKSFNKLLAFEPTGWTHSKKNVLLQDIKPKCKSNDITIYGIPYSEHSSYAELKRFVQFVRPLKILPTVNNGNAESRHKMESLFNAWLKEPMEDSVKEEKSPVQKQRSINDFITLSQDNAITKT